MRPREEIELFAIEDESKAIDMTPVARDIFRKLEFQIEVLLDIRELLQKQTKIRKRSKKESNKHRSVCSVCSIAYSEWIAVSSPMPCYKGREHRWKKQ